MAKSENTPIFGSIAMFGGWSVVFKPHGNMSHLSQSGYDREFPADRFQGIPVIDYRECETFQGLEYIREAYSNPPAGAIGLDEYLRRAVMNGCAVYCTI